MSAVNIAGLTATDGKMNRFRLRCANPECPSVKEGLRAGMDVEAVDNEKIRFTVPCIVCGGTHSAEVSRSLLEKREIFMLQCPNYGVDICFTGELKNVKYELSRSELELLDMMGEGDAADIGLEADKSKALPDPEISERIIAAVRCLEDEDLVCCRCSDEERKGRELEITQEPENICIRCKKCGAKKKIPAVSVIAAEDFLMCDSLTLE